VDKEVIVEFLIEPFREGDPGLHVTAGVDALRAIGLSVEFGALASSATGSVDVVANGIADMIRAAIGAGAQRLQLQVVAE
jgi:uncharacterized protein YqgV (UPF0045/DUF77 family)